MSQPQRACHILSAYEYARRVGLRSWNSVAELEWGGASGANQSQAITAKREFNRYFAKLAEGIKDEKAKSELRLAQDRWSEYRDKSCSAAFDFYSSGVMRAIMEFVCEIQLTKSRMKDLEIIYHSTDQK
jgi:uncharacterized protein YecT (DUF1311 family)